MDDSQKQEFSVAIGAMCASFGTDASKALLLGYWMGLRDLELQDLQRAVERSIRECTHLPRAAELRKLSGEQTGLTRSMAAWGDVLKAIPHGPYRHIDFQDRLINAVVRNMGGWPNFVGRFESAEAEKWVRIEFIKCYEAFASSGVNGEACEPLKGLSEMEACGGVVSEPVPRLIECDKSRLRLPSFTNPLSISLSRGMLLESSEVEDAN